MASHGMDGNATLLGAGAGTDTDTCAEGQVIAYISLVAILVISFALGSSLSTDSLKGVFASHKRGIACGWASQFGFMPLVAYAIAQICDYNTAMAVGCILSGCAPGGSTSNLFTYFAKGNVALSIVMSVASTLCAFFMIPLLALIYIESTYEDSSVKINYLVLAVGLFAIVLPVGLGMLLRHKNTTTMFRGKFLWEWSEIAGSIAGGVFLLVVIVVGIVLQSEFLDEGAKVWVPAMLFQPIGCGVGYLTAKMAGLDRASRRAVSLETGVQNYAFVIAVVALTWKDDCVTQRQALVFPYTATCAYVINSVLIVAGYRWLHEPRDASGDYGDMNQAVDVLTPMAPTPAAERADRPSYFADNSDGRMSLTFPASPSPRGSNDRFKDRLPPAHSTLTKGGGRGSAVRAIQPPATPGDTTGPVSRPIRIPDTPGDVTGPTMPAYPAPAVQARARDPPAFPLGMKVTSSKKTDV